MTHRPVLFFAVTISICACAGEPADPGGAEAIDAGRSPRVDASPLADADPTVPDAAPVAQLPPTNPAELLPWLMAGHYLTWNCEAEAHPARPPGAHGDTRICSNDRLAGARGDFPAGAASVKELVADGTVYGYAVAVKLETASGSSGQGWYWYEETDGDVYMEGTGIEACAGCHSEAGPGFAPTARDFVFTQVP